MNIITPEIFLTLWEELEVKSRPYPEINKHIKEKITHLKTISSDIKRKGQP